MLEKTSSRESSYSFVFAKKSSWSLCQINYVSNNYTHYANASSVI